MNFDQQIDPQKISEISYQISLEKTRSQFKTVDLEIWRLCKEEFHVIESKEDKQLKETAIGKINEIIASWMQRINEQMGISNLSANNQARVLCFGSYKLGVSSPKGDIDAIVLVPIYVDWEKHFFGTLFEILFEYSKNNINIKNLQAVNTQTSVTPLIAMNFYGVEIDLLFVSMDNIQQFDGEILEGGLSRRPNLYNDLLMDHMDEKMKRSFNGFRNAEMILESLMLPEDYDNKSDMKKRLEIFRLFVVALKMLHKKAGIYENKMGYFGGITIAMMAVKIMQLYPNYSVLHLIERFLYIYGYVWNWSEFSVQIVPEKKNPSDSKNPQIYKEQINFSEDVVFSKKKRYMEIMTPAWPQMSSTFNVCFSNKEVILNVYREKHSLVEGILKEFSQLGENCDYKRKVVEIFKEENFFLKYPYFLEVWIAGSNESQYNNWKGYVESKVRLLIEKIDQLYLVYNIKSQLYPKSFGTDFPQSLISQNQMLNSFQFKERYFIGLDLLSNLDISVDLTQIISHWIYQVELGWNSENQIRNQKFLDIFFFVRNQQELLQTQTQEEAVENQEEKEQIKEEKDLMEFLLE